jgi:RNA polymerase sigma-70 factor (ECF subfamily)
MVNIQKRIEAELPRLRRYARALVRDVVDADDLVQECLTRALAKLHLWQEGSDLRAWLFTILHNQYVNQIRRSIRMEKRLELRDLDRALGRLPAEQRAVILLVGLEGMPYSAVAEVLAIPTGTVRSRLSRGRLALRDLMGIEPNQRARRSATKIRVRRREAPSLRASAEWSGPPAAAD